MEKVMSENGKMELVDIEAAEQELHPGMVKIHGEWIDRADVCFTMKQDMRNKNIFETLDGVQYLKQKNGQMRKLTEETKESRKARKKEIQKYWQHVRMQNAQKEIHPS